MNEDDTFNKLRRIPFEQAIKIFIIGDFNLQGATLTVGNMPLNGTGWTAEELEEEFRTRYKEKE